jgi:hypothetical protein
MMHPRGGDRRLLSLFRAIAMRDDEREVNQ